MNTVILTNNSLATGKAPVNLDVLASGYISNLVLKKKAAGTIKVYTKRLNDFLRWYKATPVVSTTEEHLLTYRSYLIDKYESAKTINLMLSVVRGLYRWLFAKKHITSLQLEEFENVEDTGGLKKSSLSKDERNIIAELLRNSDNIQNHRDRILFLLLVKTGARINELANAKIEDIDYINGSKVLFLLRKGYIDKSNYVKIPNDTYQKLMEFIGTRKDGHIFTSMKTGKGMTSDTLSRVIKSILRKAGMDSKLLSAHSLRHTFAIMFLEAGGTIEQLMVEMNHKSIVTTTNYTKSFNRMNVNIDIDFDI